MYQSGILELFFAAKIRETCMRHIRLALSEEPGDYID